MTMQEALMHEFSDRKPRRRRHPRVESSVPLFFQGKQASGRSHTCDLSLTGARLIVYGEVEPDEEIQVTLNLADHASVTLTARTVWREQNGTVNTVGVEFINTGVGGRAALTQFLAQRTPPEQEPISPPWAHRDHWLTGTGSCGGPKGAALN